MIRHYELWQNKMLTADYFPHLLKNMVWKIIKCCIYFVTVVNVHHRAAKKYLARGSLPYINYTNMCRCPGYGFQTIQSRTGCINHGNFCLEQGIKFCNIRKLFFTGCNNSSRMRIGLTGFWGKWNLNFEWFTGLISV